jgi:hypothetical protein
MIGPHALLSVLQFYYSVLNFLAAANPNLALFQGSISAKLWQAARVSASRLTLRLEAVSTSEIGSLCVMVFALGQVLNWYASSIGNGIMHLLTGTFRVTQSMARTHFRCQGKVPPPCLIQA